MTKIDDFDRALLGEIQRDTRQTYQSLGHKLNLSESAVRRRLKKLRKSGLIDREVAILNHDRQGFTVIVGVRCTKESDDVYARLCQRWYDCDEVREIYNTSGEADFILIGHFPDMPAYDTWLKKFVVGDPDVARCDSSFAFKTLKFETSIPIKSFGS